MSATATTTDFDSALKIAGTMGTIAFTLTIIELFGWTISVANKTGFFLDDFPGDAGGQNLRYFEFFCLFCWVFEKNLLSFRNMLSFLREYWVFPTKTLSFSEKSFKFIQYSPAFYKITFFSFNISYPRYIFALQPSLVASKTSGTLSFAENGEENLRYLEF